MAEIQFNDFYTKDISLGKAVRTTLEPSQEVSGVAERATRLAENCAEFLGELTEILHAKELLSEEELRRLLGYQITMERIS